MTSASCFVSFMFMTFATASLVAQVVLTHKLSSTSRQLSLIAEKKLNHVRVVHVCGRFSFFATLFVRFILRVVFVRGDPCSTVRTSEVLTPALADVCGSI